MRASEARIEIVGDNRLTPCRLCASASRLARTVRVFGIRQVSEGDQQPAGGGSGSRGYLGVCPSNGMGRVRGAAGSAARRRDDRDVIHLGGAATTRTAPRRHEPLGTWGLRPHASLLVVNDATSIVSSSRLAWDSQAPCARPMLLLGQAPSRSPLRRPRSR